MIYRKKYSVNTTVEDHWATDWGNSVICGNMDRTEVHDGKWNKADTERWVHPHSHVGSKTEVEVEDRMLVTSG